MALNKSNKKQLRSKKYVAKREVGIIRDRYQITIPKELRDQLKWIKQDTPINIQVKGDSLIINNFNKIIKPKWKKHKST